MEIDWADWSVNHPDDVALWAAAHYVDQSVSTSRVNKVKNTSHLLWTITAWWMTEKYWICDKPTIRLRETNWTHLDNQAPFLSQVSNRFYCRLYNEINHIVLISLVALMKSRAILYTLMRARLWWNFGAMFLSVLNKSVMVSVEQ